MNGQRTARVSDRPKFAPPLAQFFASCWRARFATEKYWLTRYHSLAESGKLTRQGERAMNLFAVLIFEINCYEYEPFVKINWCRSFAWERRPKKSEQASIWLHIATDGQGKRRALATPETSCLKLCGPVDWATADELLQGIKVAFDRPNIGRIEPTCSDD